MKSLKEQHPIAMIACAAVILIVIVWAVITFVLPSGDAIDLPVSEPPVETAE